MKSFIKKVDFPVYGLDFTVDDRIVAVGGGGAGKSGVKNKLVIITIKSIYLICNIIKSRHRNCILLLLFSYIGSNFYICFFIF